MGFAKWPKKVKFGTAVAYTVECVTSTVVMSSLYGSCTTYHGVPKYIQKRGYRDNSNMSHEIWLKLLHHRHRPYLIHIYNLSRLNVQNFKWAHQPCDVSLTFFCCCWLRRFNHLRRRRLCSCFSTSQSPNVRHRTWRPFTMEFFVFFLSAQSHDTNRNGYMNFSRKPQDHWPFSLKEFRNEENRT